MVNLIQNTKHILTNIIDIYNTVFHDFFIDDIITYLDSPVHGLFFSHEKYFDKLRHTYIFLRS